MPENSSSSFTALDCCVPVTSHLELLKRSGITLVLRYLNPLGPSQKQCGVSEAEAIAKAGLRLGLVSEGWGDFAHGGISAAAGERDAEHALVTAPKLGASEGAGVYFAVDLDASEQEISKLVLPYFVEVRRLLSPKFRVGVYGSGLVCSRVLDVRLADLAWLACSTGWRGSRDFLASGRWAIAQKVPKRVGNFEFDPDDVRGDAGDFEPFKPVTGPQLEATRPVSPLELLISQVSHALSRGKMAVEAAAAPVTGSIEVELAKILKGTTA